MWAYCSVCIAGGGAGVVNGCRPIRPRWSTWPPPWPSSWWPSWPTRLQPSTWNQGLQLWKLGPRDLILVIASHSTRFDCHLIHHPPAYFLILHSSLFLSLSHSQPSFETSVCIFIHIPVLAKVALSASLPSVIGSRPYYPPCLGSDRRQKCVYFDQNNPNHATPDQTISNWPNNKKSNKTAHAQQWQCSLMKVCLMSYAYRWK